MQNMDPKDFRDMTASQGAPPAMVADVSMPVVPRGTPETTAIYADGQLFARTLDGIICYDLRATSRNPE